ncbi:MAG: hypothetical protein B7Z02_14775 [Rhodobacterales bacterium 32-67-9]|nr:MAG: hypothetical protein B7Z02_14775 [Rhodobacterales bacterium 32-67-9]
MVPPEQDPRIRRSSDDEMAKIDTIKNRVTAKARRADLGRLAGRLVVILFMLALGLAGGPRVHAMGTSSDVTATVICSEGGARTLYLKADGTPARPAQDCAECPLCIALSVQGLTPPEHALPLRLARRSSARRREGAVMPATRNRRPKSRAPPAIATLNGIMQSHTLDTIKKSSSTADSTKVKSAGPEVCHRTARHHEDVQR